MAKPTAKQRFLSSETHGETRGETCRDIFARNISLIKLVRQKFRAEFRATFRAPFFHTSLGQSFANFRAQFRAAIREKMRPRVSLRGCYGRAATKLRYPRNNDARCLLFRE